MPLLFSAAIARCSLAGCNVQCTPELAAADAMLWHVPIPPQLILLDDCTHFSFNLLGQMSFACSSWLVVGPVLVMFLFFCANEGNPSFPLSLGLELAMQQSINTAKLVVLARKI